MYNRKSPNGLKVFSRTIKGDWGCVDRAGAARHLIALTVSALALGACTLVRRKAAGCAGRGGSGHLPRVARDDQVQWRAGLAGGVA